MSAAAVLWAAAGFAQTDNFNSRNDNAWTRLDFSVIGLPGFADYTFPSDGSGGAAYRIEAFPSPDEASLGPGRALSYREDVTYTGRFVQGVDVLAWNDVIDQAFGPFWYAQDMMLGFVSGYVMTYDPAVPELLISRITQEARTTIGQTAVYLDPAGDYRFTVSSADGVTFLAEISYASEPENPVATAYATDNVYGSGLGALLVFDGGSKGGADATFDNYAASVPAAGSLGAKVVQLSPGPREKCGALLPTVKAAILDRETSVDPATIHLWVDGALIPAGQMILSTGVVWPPSVDVIPGETMSYAITNVYAYGSEHTNQVAFTDNLGNRKTNTWTWISAYPCCQATNALPSDAGISRGFSVRLVRADSGYPMANSIPAAEAQLAKPPMIPAVFSIQTNVMTINFTQDVANDPAGVFPYESSFPGVDPTNCVKVALEALAYFELPEGKVTFGVKSDDGFKFTAGAGFRDRTGSTLGLHSGGTFAGTFDVVVEKAGVYPLRFVWNQGEGPANVQLYSLDGVGNPVLVNDTNAPAAIKAYVAAKLPIVVESSAVLDTSTFTPETSVAIDWLAKTVTVPESGTPRYYRLKSNSALLISNIQAVGTNVVMTYE